MIINKAQQTSQSQVIKITGPTVEHLLGEAHVKIAALEQAYRELLQQHQALLQLSKSAEEEKEDDVND